MYMLTFTKQTEERGHTRAWTLSLLSLLNTDTLLLTVGNPSLLFLILSLTQQNRWHPQPVRLHLWLEATVNYVGAVTFLKPPGEMRQRAAFVPLPLTLKVTHRKETFITLTRGRWGERTLHECLCVCVWSSNLKNWTDHTFSLCIFCVLYIYSYLYIYKYIYLGGGSALFISFSS